MTKPSRRHQSKIGARDDRSQLGNEPPEDAPRGTTERSEVLMTARNIEIDTFRETDRFTRVGVRQKAPPRGRETLVEDTMTQALWSAARLGAALSHEKQVVMHIGKGRADMVIDHGPAAPPPPTKR